MAIDKLSSVSSVAAGDYVALFSAALGKDARATLTTLAARLQTQITSLDDKITQYAAPNATAFSVTIAPGSDGGSVFLLLTPAAGYATGTVVLPALASCADKQEVLVHCTQAVTTLTVSGNGATVNGAPTTLAANAYFRLRYDATMESWYRVG